jgi:hypothetical protein
MFGCFHRQVQGIRAGQFRDPLAWVDELRADDEGRKNASSSSFGCGVISWLFCVMPLGKKPGGGDGGIENEGHQ